MKTRIFAFAALMMLIALPGRAQDTRTIDNTYPLSRDGELFIDTFKGSITIETWDKAEVKVHAVIAADGTGKDDRDKVKETEVRVSDSPTRIRIKSDYDRVKSHFSLFNMFDDNSGSLPFVHYTVTMPATARLKIKDYKSESHIANLHSSVELETYKGSAVISGLEGAIDLETYKGDIDLAFGKLTDRSRLETRKGRVRVALPSSAGFEVDTDLGRHADFTSDFDLMTASKHRNDAIHGTVNGGGPLLRIISEKGDIRLLKL